MSNEDDQRRELARAELTHDPARIAKAKAALAEASGKAGAKKAEPSKAS